jgi:STE24 endopeptidase
LTETRKLAKLKGMNVYLVIILAAIIARYLLETAADWLNVRHISPRLPGEFEGFYDDKTYRKSQEYLRDNTRLGMVSDTVNTLVILGLILFGGFNFFDTAARSLGFNPIATGLAFALMIGLFLKIMNLPFSVYDTFVIEEKYGFNKTTPRTYILDQVKSLLIAAILGGAAFSLVVWLFREAGEPAWVYCWITLTAFQVLILFLAPYVILPLFNKYTPLEEGELRSRIEDYARSQNFTIKGVYKMDGSKRSARSNAFFTGFGKSRRIVLFDTLIEKHTVPELVAIIAHEMGHYKKRHIPQAIVRSVAKTGLVFFLLSLFIDNPGLFDAFGMKHMSVYAGLIFFGFLFAPVNLAIALAETAISRKHEYEADAFTVQTTSDPETFITALKKLNVDNLGNLTPHPLKVKLSYSHPPVLQRIKAIRRWK